MSSNPQDYFSLLGLPRSFDIDVLDLEKRYFDAQRKFHPDRLLGKNAAERAQAISESMQANSAYETLKSPLKRANYMLCLYGIAQDKVKPSQGLIMEVMELREQLADAEYPAALEKMEIQNEENKNTILSQLAHAFTENNIPRASEIAIQLSYIAKIQDEIRVKKKALIIRT